MCYQGSEAGDFALGIGSGGMVQLLVAAVSAQKALVRSLKLNPDPAWNERGPRRDGLAVARPGSATTLQPPSAPQGYQALSAADSEAMNDHVSRALPVKW